MKIEFSVVDGKTRIEIEEDNALVRTVTTPGMSFEVDIGPEGKRISPENDVETNLLAGRLR